MFYLHYNRLPMNTHESNISSSMLNSEIDKRIKLIIQDCCMKKIVRTTMYNLFNKTLTSKECILICLYYYIFMFSFIYIIVSCNIVYMWFSYYLNLYYVSKIISIVINILIIIKVVEELKEFEYILFCSCEKDRNRINNQ